MMLAEPLPGWRGRFFHSENVTMASYEIDADAVPIHEHHHPQEEVWIVTSGRLALTIGDAEQVLYAGDAAVVPPDTPHHARALTASTVIIVDHPLRLQIPGQTRRSS